MSVSGSVSQSRMWSEVHEWSVPDFFDSEIHPDELIGPSFHILGTILNFRIPFRINTVIDKIGGYLIYSQKHEVPKRLCCTIGFKKSDGTVENGMPIIIDETRRCLPGVHPFDFGFADLRRRRSELLPSGVLTIVFRFDVDVVWIRFARMTSQSTQTYGFLDRLSRDLKDLLSSGDDSDATVRVKGQEIPVHRAILGARMPVFSDMFRHGMSEGASGIVEIDDCEPDAFRAFLHYVYTREVEVTAESAAEVYKVADKYQVGELKEACVERIKSGLSIESFCQVATLALKHEEKELIAVATDFLAWNLMKVMQTIEWNRFMCENPVQGQELLLKSLALVKELGISIW